MMNPKYIMMTGILLITMQISCENDGIKVSKFEESSEFKMILNAIIDKNNSLSISRSENASSFSEMSEKKFEEMRSRMQKQTAQFFKIARSEGWTNDEIRSNESKYIDADIIEIKRKMEIKYPNRIENNKTIKENIKKLRKDFPNVSLEEFKMHIDMALFDNLEN